MNDVSLNSDLNEAVGPKVSNKETLISINSNANIGCATHLRDVSCLSNIYPSVMEI